MIFADLILAAFLGYGLYKGIRNGLFVELASLLAFIIGIYVAVKFSYLMRDFIARQVSWSGKTVQVTAFIVTLVLVIIGIFLLAKAFTKIADFAFLGCMNRIAGGVFGCFPDGAFSWDIFGIIAAPEFEKPIHLCRKPKEIVAF